MNIEQDSTSVGSGTFSLKFLFALTAIAALLAAVGRAYGDAGVFTAVSLFFVASFSTGYQGKQKLEYLKCVGAAILIPGFVSSFKSRWFDESAAYLAASVFGIGVMLLISVIRRGHWSLVLAATLIMIFYIWTFAGLATNTFSNWQFYCDYWRGNLYDPNQSR